MASKRKSRRVTRRIDAMVALTTARTAIETRSAATLAAKAGVTVDTIALAVFSAGYRVGYVACIKDEDVTS